MKDYKVRQKIYHVNASITGHKDDLETIARTEKIEHKADFQEIVDCTIAHFRTEQPNLIYPCKSYFVALIYAKLLEKHFKEPFLDSLRDPDLLYGNDKYFLPYGIAYQVYDAVIAEVGEVLDRIANDDLACLPSQVKSTVGYFREEFQVT